VTDRDSNVDYMVADRKNELDRKLRLCLKQIDNQMEEIRQEAVRTQTPPVTMRDSKGDLLLPPLLTAKADVLRSLVVMDYMNWVDTAQSTLDALPKE